MPLFKEIQEKALKLKTMESSQDGFVFSLFLL